MNYKIIYRNIKRNFSIYSIYLGTLAFIYGLFFSFNSVVNKPELSKMSDAKKILAGFLEQFTGILSVLMSISFSFLVIYVTMFILKKRGKELGIYSSIGMKNSKIAILMIKEIFVLNTIATILGLVLGFVLSIFVSKVYSVFFGASDVGYLNLNTKAVVITLVCSIIAFGITSIIVYKKINKENIIALLISDAKNEDSKEYSFKIQLIKFLISIIIFLGIAFFIGKESSIKVTLKYSPLIVILALLATFFFYSTISELVLKLCKKSSFYYKKSNSIVFARYSSKSKSNIITISVLSLFLMLSFSVMYVGFNSYITLRKEAKKFSPYNVSLIKLENKEKEELLPIEKSLESHSINIDDISKKYVKFNFLESNFKYSDVVINKSDLWHVDKRIFDMNVPIISISAFNKLMELQNKNSINLCRDEFFINCNYKGTFNLIEDFLEREINIDINGTTLKNTNKYISEEILFMTSVGNNDKGTLVVPDAVASSLKITDSVVNAIYKDGVNENEQSKLFNDWCYENMYQDEKGLHFNYGYQTRDLMEGIYYGTMGVFVFLASLLGLIFTFIALCILSIQMITESADFKNEKPILISLGYKEKQVKTIMKKICMLYFLTPCLTALPASLIIGKKVFSYFENFMNVTIERNSVVFVGILMFFAIYILITLKISNKILKE